MNDRPRRRNASLARIERVAARGAYFCRADGPTRGADARHLRRSWRGGIFRCAMWISGSTTAPDRALIDASEFECAVRGDQARSQRPIQNRRVWVPACPLGGVALGKTTGAGPRHQDTDGLAVCAGVVVRPSPSWPRRDVEVATVGACVQLTTECEQANATNEGNDMAARAPTRGSQIEGRERANAAQLLRISRRQLRNRTHRGARWGAMINGDRPRGDVITWATDMMRRAPSFTPAGDVTLEHQSVESALPSGHAGAREGRS
jgi:hypothetical protein